MKRLFSFKICIVILVLIQSMMMFYWGFAKEAYYVDEYFTYETTHYLSESTTGRIKLYDKIEHGTWSSVGELKDTLMITDKSTMLHDSLEYNLKTFFTKRPFLTIVNYIITLRGGYISKWNVIGFNIILFILSQFVLYRITDKITKNYLTKILVLSFYGFSGMAISMVVYIRFYVWVSLFTLIFTYLHLLILENDNIWKNIIYEIGALIAIYLAFLESPLVILYGTALIIMFSLMLLIRNRKKMCAYILPMLGIGFVYLNFKTNYIDALIHPDKYAAQNFSALQYLTNNIVSISSAEMGNRVKEILGFLSDFMFGQVIIMLLFVVLMIALLVCFLQRRKENKIQNNHEKENEILQLFGGTLIIFFIAALAVGLNQIRYISFACPVLSAFLICYVMFLGRKTGKNRIAKKGMSILILLSIVATFSVPRVDTLYREEKKVIERIKRYGDRNIVFIDYGDGDDAAMYECIDYCDADANIIFIKSDEYDNLNFGEEFIVWQRQKYKCKILQDLTLAGYSNMKNLGQTHESTVFYCSRE